MPSVEVVQELQEAPVKKKSRERRVYVDPFQVGRRISIMSGQDLSDAHIKRYCDMKVDKETGVAYPVYETIDLQQEIESPGRTSNDLTGMSKPALQVPVTVGW